MVLPGCSLPLAIPKVLSKGDELLDAVSETTNLEGGGIDMLSRLTILLTVPALERPFLLVLEDPEDEEGRA